VSSRPSSTPTASGSQKGDQAIHINKKEDMDIQLDSIISKL